jgi:1-deoxy-D-xylulose-5-phosphate reductoisomerase
VNKGLEVIEAHLLFGLPMDRIEVVVHPQSIVHSMVEFFDGSTIAQASPPDMRLPISLALGWPARIDGAAAALDWSSASSWEFAPLDSAAFPAVELARRAGTSAGTAPAVFNAANEVAVGAFLSGRASFVSIVDTVALVLDQHLQRVAQESTGTGHEPMSLTVDDVLAADLWARGRAAEVLDTGVEAPERRGAT